MTTSWQSIVFGGLTALGVYLTSLAGAPSWVAIVGQVLTVAAGVLTGLFHPTTSVGVIAPAVSSSAPTTITPPKA